jgi:hypothetical protein
LHPRNYSCLNGMRSGRPERQYSRHAEHISSYQILCSACEDTVRVATSWDRCNCPQYQFPEHVKWDSVMPTIFFLIA